MQYEQLRLVFRNKHFLFFEAMVVRFFTAIGSSVHCAMYTVFDGRRRGRRRSVSTVGSGALPTDSNQGCGDSSEMSSIFNSTVGLIFNVSISGMHTCFGSIDNQIVISPSWRGGSHI